jgi:hypothetical protein
MTLLRDAINRLIAAGLSASDVAHALGITNGELRDLRTATSVRLLDEAPVEWYQVLAAMAWERGGLETLAHKLDRA